ncbi:zonadhesin [Tripterygium wilfordii]|uniref:Zonadhesin n=1 Tax=Tripterygium wilfordii TaxID=458696 RepID=A0A7J7CPW9_TRIWF|nr:zonadhesin [Tripterygium wilfordii]
MKSMKPHKLDSYEKESKPSSQIGDSTNTVDDFRPATPRNSPGVGHAEEEEEKYNNKALGASHDHNSIAGAKDDFRPTEPGHSPGVGHLLQNQLDDKDDFRPTDPGHSPGVGHSRNFVTGGAKDDFRPTGPGHSPGVGHLLEQDKHSANIAGDKEDFRPTDPGHSPGIGHHALVPNKNRQP